MSDDNGQIPSFVDRILRMKEEAASISADIREIYAEAKGSGLDKTALGNLVSYIAKRQKGETAFAEREANFELYLAAYDGVGRMRMPAHEKSLNNSAPKQIAAPQENLTEASLGRVMLEAKAAVSAPKPKATILPPEKANGSGKAEWLGMLETKR